MLLPRHLLLLSFLALSYFGSQLHAVTRLPQDEGKFNFSFSFNLSFAEVDKSKFMYWCRWLQLMFWIKLLRLWELTGHSVLMLVKIIMILSKLCLRILLGQLIVIVRLTIVFAMLKPCKWILCWEMLIFTVYYCWLTCNWFWVYLYFSVGLCVLV